MSSLSNGDIIAAVGSLRDILGKEYTINEDQDYTNVIKDFRVTIPGKLLKEFGDECLLFKDALLKQDIKKLMEIGDRMKEFDLTGIKSEVLSERECFCNIIDVYRRRIIASCTDVGTILEPVIADELAELRDKIISVVVQLLELVNDDRADVFFKNDTYE